jgi:hypothetical protein
MAPRSAVEAAGIDFRPVVHAIRHSWTIIGKSIPPSIPRWHREDAVSAGDGELDNAAIIRRWQLR